MKEYRCRCGKLLFKGSIVLSAVEIKCKRCGNLEIFRGEERDAPLSFSVTIDGSGTIIDTCRTIVCVGWNRRSLVGKHFSTLFPLLRDAPDMRQFSPPGGEGKRLGTKKGKSGQFEIRNNTLVLRDGGSASAESYIIPRSVDDSSLGHYIFTVVPSRVSS